MDTLEEYIKIDVKLYKKLNRKIIGLTYLKNFFEIDEKLFSSFFKKYESLIMENQGSFIIVDARNLGTVNLSSIPVDKLKRMKKLDDIVSKNIICISYIVKGIVIKNTINAVVKLFPPIVPVKVCNEPVECFQFFEKNMKTENN